MMADSSDRPPAILIVDDDELLRTNLAEVQTEAGYAIEQARTGQEATDLLGEKEKDLIITDIFMAYIDGIELVRRMQKKAGNTRLLVMSG